MPPDIRKQKTDVKKTSVFRNPSSGTLSRSNTFQFINSSKFSHRLELAQGDLATAVRAFSRNRQL